MNATIAVNAIASLPHLVVVEHSSQIVREAPRHGHGLRVPMAVGSVSPPYTAGKHPVTTYQVSTQGWHCHQQYCQS